MLRARVCRGANSSVCALLGALAVEPPVLLMDEPTSALDPISTAKIEELMTELRKNVTVVIVTHKTATGRKNFGSHRLFPARRADRTGRYVQAFHHPQG